MTDEKKMPKDETLKAQTEEATSSEDLSDDELGNAAGGVGNTDLPPVDGINQW